MSNKSFVPLNEYDGGQSDYLVPDKLYEADDDDGVLGKIVDRGASFIPRAMRFKKAKKIMRKFLAAFTKKAKKLVNEFAKGFKSKVDTIDKEYKTMIQEKVKPLMAEDKTEEAVALLENQKKELEEYKKEQVSILDKGIDDILGAYTSSIDHRIDNPGFVLNVELSEKGKGELKAKWQELTAIQKIEIDKEKTKLISSPGWKRLESMIAEMNGLIKNNKTITADIDIFVQNIQELRTNEFKVKTHVRASGSRVALKEKGIIVGPESASLEYEGGARTIKDISQYALNVRTFALNVRAPKGEFVRPYLIFKDSKKPVYGDIASLEDSNIKRGEGDDRIKSEIKDGGPLDDEKPEISDENK